MPAHLPAPCSQAALLRTSKAWAAVGTRCSPVEVEVGLSSGSCWPLGKRWGGRHRHLEPEQLPSGGLPAAAAWLAQQRRMVWRLDLQLDPMRQRRSTGRKAGGSQSAEDADAPFSENTWVRAQQCYACGNACIAVALAVERLSLAVAGGGRCEPHGS